MKVIRPNDIFTISKPGAQICLSVYANSAHELVEHVLHIEKIAKKDMDPDLLDELLEPFFHFMSFYTWDQESFKTVALYSTRGFSGYLELPFHSKALGVVSKSFHVKPLFKWLQREKPFFVVKIEADKAVLSMGSLSGIQKITELYAPSLKNQSRKLYSVIKNERYPLILVGEENATRRMREILKYKPIIAEIGGSMEEGEIHHSLMKYFEPYYQSVEKSEVDSYYRARLRRLTSSSLNDITRLALRGGVRHLFVNENLNIWGEIDYQKGDFVYHRRQMNSLDDDVLDDLAEIVKFYGGKVTVLPREKMPDSHAACAILYKRDSPPSIEALADFRHLTLQNAV